MKRILAFLRSLDWRVLLAVPVLSVLLGVLNNLRVSEDQRVRWSGERVKDVAVKTDAVGAKRGVWTADFTAATNAAAAAHVPVVVVVTQQGCQYCARLHKALDSVAVKTWQKKRGWYFVLVDRDKRPDAYEFVLTTPTKLTAAPYVGVYWTRADGTQAMRNFPGRAGRMEVFKDKTLALEWMRAVEASVHGAPGLNGGDSVSSIARSSKVRVAAAVDLQNGAAGRVKMSPRVTFIKEGQKVTLTAEPKRGSVFAGWRHPDGRIVYGKSRMTLGSHSQSGTYTAVFRRLADCAAPKLSLPERELAWTEGRYEKLTLRVNADARPVSFACEGLPPGMFLTSRTAGVVQGRPQTNGVWRVEVTASGMSRALPEAKGAFTVRVAPRPVPKAGAGEDEDDVGGTDEDDEVN